MRLKGYINEGKIQDLSNFPPEEIVKQIKTNCKKYLKLLGNKHPVYRGMNIRGDTIGSSVIGTKVVRQNRNPQGTEPKAFKFVNQWLDKKGWPRRDKSVICTSDDGYAASFNELYYIFPVDSNYGYAWVESQDFNDQHIEMYSEKRIWGSDFVESSVNGQYYGDFIGYEDGEANAIEHLNKFVHGNKRFNTAYSNEYEIWFDCKQFYYLRDDIVSGNYTKKGKELKNEFKKAKITV